MKKLLFLLIFLPLVNSCKDKNAIPKDVLPKEKMQAVLWSMIGAGEYLNAFAIRGSAGKVAEASKVYGEVFQIHHITRDQFDRSFAFYRDHPDLMKAIVDSLSKKQNYDVERFRRAGDSTHKKVIGNVDTR